MRIYDMESTLNKILAVEAEKLGVRFGLLEEIIQLNIEKDGSDSTETRSRQQAIRRLLEDEIGMGDQK